MCIRDSANAFLGVCHSMAHKLGAFHHLPHGVANALLITKVMEYNAAECPRKMGTFSQYEYPHTLARYAECARFCGIVGKDDKDTLKKFIDKDVYKRQMLYFALQEADRRTDLSIYTDVSKEGYEDILAKAREVYAEGKAADLEGTDENQAAIDAAADALDAAIQGLVNKDAYDQHYKRYRERKAAVSYTHLDVYKRQLLLRLKTGRALKILTRLFGFPMAS